jgi:hypothetical protein
VVGPYVDTYWNLSVKTAHIVRWPERQGLSCKWVIKCDVDVYARPKELWKVLEGLQKGRHVYAGAL